jgi:hypothetical protein
MTGNARIASPWLSVPGKGPCAYGLELAHAGTDRARCQTEKDSEPATAPAARSARDLIRRPRICFGANTDRMWPSTEPIAG